MKYVQAECIKYRIPILRGKKTDSIWGNSASSSPTSSTHRSVLSRFGSSAAVAVSGAATFSNAGMLTSGPETHGLLATNASRQTCTKFTKGCYRYCFQHKETKTTATSEEKSEGCRRVVQNSRHKSEAPNNEFQKVSKRTKKRNTENLEKFLSQSPKKFQHSFPLEESHLLPSHPLCFQTHYSLPPLPLPLAQEKEAQL